MGLIELIEADSVIKTAKSKINEIKAKAYQEISPLTEQIYSREKQIAVDFGFAVRTIAEMPKGKNLRFRKHVENGISKYKAKGANESYVHCNFCRLYIKNDALDKIEFNDLGNHTEGIHEAGTKYHCPICSTELYKKIDGSMAVG